jgi:hypothetical protein
MWASSFEATKTVRTAYNTRASRTTVSPQRLLTMGCLGTTLNSVERFQGDIE